MLSLKRVSCLTRLNYMHNLNYYKHFYRYCASLKSMDDIPSNFGQDEIKEYVLSPYEFWKNKINKYGDLFKLTIGGADVVIVTDLKLMKEAYNMELKHKCQRGYTPETVDLIGNSFVTKASQLTHRQMRRDWNPLFTSKKVKNDYSEIIEKETIKLLDTMVNKNEYINVFDIVTNYALDCSVQIWLGKTILNEMKENKSELYKLFPDWNIGYNVIDRSDQNEENAWNNSIKSLKLLKKELEYYINRANELYVENNLEMNTVLYKFLSKEQLNKYWNTQEDKSDPFWGDELGELLAIMMTDAFNTPIYNNLFYILSENQNEQFVECVEILRKELFKNDTIYNVNNIGELLDEVPYLEYFSHEVLRYFPTLNLFLREISKDIEFNGYVLPKHTMISSPISYFNFSEKYWDKPHEFNPMRWHPDNAQTNNKKAFVSFSTGNRTCLGKDLVLMEVSVFLTQFIKYNYKIKSHVTGAALYPFNTIPLDAIVYK
eukprot:474789_1